MCVVLVRIKCASPVHALVCCCPSAIGERGGRSYDADGSRLARDAALAQCTPHTLAADSWTATLLPSAPAQQIPSRQPGAHTLANLLMRYWRSHAPLKCRCDKSELTGERERRRARALACLHWLHWRRSGELERKRDEDEQEARTGELGGSNSLLFAGSVLSPGRTNWPRRPTGCAVSAA